ncbi:MULTISPECIES: type I restriction-modification system subunit M [Rhodococcus]|uniref:type I restriction-modification system subunit M n=1 Tax=Rhodococcus TaxID=1827 RepID=UPI0009C31878|nr:MULTISPECIES: class I SAM-dependent DNA methyltransferase [Rhodococcus]ARE38052.1 restriction endonuclease subunit M [Rhodococcus sp. BH4]MBQ9056075.1 SAM-dependent DNA methyltransferase [Rhodococcus sp. (in: high G+C Gram-positive bacteria)]QXC46391.1 type I restriction-modification system subunit M [Rhodococcus qingshengii]
MSTLGSFIWSIADQLRGPYRPNQYGNVILPLTILRRLDCIIEPDRDTVRELAAKYDNPNRLKIEVKKATGRPFYNTSNYSFANLLKDADGLADNLVDYIDRFSPDVDVFEYFDFKKEIPTLDKAALLREVITSFKAIDLHPDVVSNADMGDAFEYIIRKFNEAANETSGDHYTPRDAIRLLVDLLFAEKDVDLTEAGIIRTLYDPTAGTGGMLALAEEHLLAQNPDAKLSLYGQEYNGQSYAICKSDLLSKGHDATNIAFGNTLTDDAFKGRQFDFCMSNPPYGVDWKQYAKAVTKERDEAGPYGRFAPGVPATSDGQMLFLLHLAHKMRAPEDGGGRVGIVMNGSPLFNGAAESGPSNIRKWLLENDLVEAIIALPTNMFFNTGIATYIWILDNTKHPDRKGLVQLIDGTSFWTKMRKNLGSKGREISNADRAEVVKLYADFTDADPDYSKVLRNDEFGYWTVTVERPLLNEGGKPVVDRKGKSKPDSKKRDTENVPFTYGGSTAGATAKTEVIQAHFDAEVRPHVPDAWIDWTKVKTGYEIPFTRHFYKYVPPRPLVEIDADLEKQVAKILELLREVEG